MRAIQIYIPEPLYVLGIPTSYGLVKSITTPYLAAKVADLKPTLAKKC